MIPGWFLWTLGYVMNLQATGQGIVANIVTTQKPVGSIQASINKMLAAQAVLPAPEFQAKVKRMPFLARAAVVAWIRQMQKDEPGRDDLKRLEQALNQ